MKKLLSLILSISTLYPLIAQHQITGKVTNQEQTPIQYANVLLFHSVDSSFVKGLVTKENGDFELANIEVGTFYLRVQMMGFQDFYGPVFELDESSSLKPFQIELREADIELDQVDLVAKRPMFQQEIDRTIVNVQNSISATGATALEILSRSPGVSIDRMNEQLVMQGKQGVIVMLNGKRVRMEMDALLQLLQSMPSSNLDKIELITTPPASYDAEGNAGIINIITIQKEDDGINGNFTLNGSYGLRPKFGSSVNLNIRKKSFNLFADFSGNYDYSKEVQSIRRRNVFGNQVTTSEVSSNRLSLTKLYSGRIGMDIYASEKTVIGVLFSGYFRDWDMDAKTTTEVNDSHTGFFLNELEITEINEWEHWMANLNFRHTFSDESNLSFDFDYLNYMGINPVSYDESNFNSENVLINTGNFSSTKETPIDFKVAKLDYSKKWSDKLSAQAGMKGTISTFVNDLSLSQLESGSRIYDPRFTDIGSLDEKIGAMYVSMDYQITEKVTTKSGLRYEYYDSKLHSNIKGELVNRQFGRLFPSFYLTYQPNEYNQFQFSYAERINRPAFSELAPFFFFYGYNTVFTGNPQVKPTISKQLSASYRHKGLLFNLEFTDQRDPITYQPKILAEDNFFIINAENMHNMKTAMLSVNAPLKITDWWESRYSVSGYWAQFQPIYQNEILTFSNMYFIGNLSQNFSLPKDFDLEFTSMINSARSWGLGKSHLNWRINMGIQKSVSTNTKISFSWNDMFNLGSRWMYTLNQPDLNIEYNWGNRVEGNLFRFTLTHQFGNTKLKKATNRETGSREERQRMN